MNIEYTKIGDYLLPNLTIKKQDYKQISECSLKAHWLSRY